MPSIRARVPILLLVLGCLPSGIQAQQAPASLLGPIDQIVSAAMAQQRLPAVSAGAALDGKIIFEKVYGFADMENLVPARPDTLFRTGSIAKPITAVAAMELVEAGKLDLDASVQKYCSSFPEKEWKVTARQLLSHTSGIRHYENDEADSTRHFATLTEGFSLFANDPLKFEPGTQFLYSTYAYSVLGCVIEGASGSPYAGFVGEHVLRPAGMAHTLVDDVFALVPHRARGYQKINGQMRNAGLMDSSYKVPGGGWITTADDLLRFALALMDGKLLRPETLALMWTSATLRDGKETGYGLGFDIGRVAAEKTVAHSGSQQGTSTALILAPRRKLASVILVNMNGIDASAVDRKVAELLLGGP